jgi:hypothetical protein
VRERLRRTLKFWRRRGSAELCRLIVRKIGDALAGKPLFNALQDESVPPGAQAPWTGQGMQAEAAATVLQLADARFPNLRPLKTYVTPAPGRRRVTMVTDSLSKGSLFGGVGTAIILAAQLSNRLDATLRIITRTEEAPPENLSHILSVYGLVLKKDPQLLFASTEDRLQEVDLQPKEIFLTTSWWTTAATLPAVPHADIIYLLQEDERMFYPYGDERLMCERVLSRSDIRFIVNTQLLFDHFVDSGLRNIAEHGLWFEPAFPPAVFRPRIKEPFAKKCLFFYARPNNARNLFYLGIEVIHRAISEGVLDAKQWRICLVGKDVPAVAFGDISVQRLADLNWSEYADLAGSVDLALSLMCTPHPSYPPLDLAASGAVVVTNRFGNKQDLSTYSSNILCADCEVGALVEALRRGVALTQSPSRQSNFEQNRIQTSWEQTFAPILEGVTRF